MDSKNNIRRAIVAAQISEAMAKAGLSRKQLAVKMGRTPSEVTRWLSGNHNFTIDLLAEISEAVGAQITGVVDDSVDGYSERDSSLELLKEPGRSYGTVHTVHLIIPSKILKQMSLKDNTKYELTLESDSLIQIRKISSRLDPVFPKIDIPELTAKEMNHFFDDLMVIGPSDLEKDERLAYILER